MKQLFNSRMINKKPSIDSSEVCHSFADHNYAWLLCHSFDAIFENECKQQKFLEERWRELTIFRFKREHSSTELNEEVLIYTILFNFQINKNSILSTSARVRRPTPMPFFFPLKKPNFYHKMIFF